MTIPQGRLRRTAPLAALSARAAGGGVVDILRRRLKGERGASLEFHVRNAERYADVLSRYLQKKGPALSRQPELDELSSTSPLSIIVADTFEDYGGFSQWLHGEVGTLSLNPLFRLEGNTLRRTFPSPWYEEDNDACKRYLPESVTISPDVLEDVWRGRRTPSVELLIDQFVVLGLPHRFGHPNAPVRQILERARRDSLAVSSKRMAKATGKVRTPNAY